MARWVRRVKVTALINGNTPPEDVPWVCDWRSYDIPETVSSIILDAPANMVAISLSLLGGPRMIEEAEAAADLRNIRILWWVGPSDHKLPIEAKQRLLDIARTVRNVN